jgi:hypothetical protein
MPFDAALGELNLDAGFSVLEEHPKLNDSMRRSGLFRLNGT